MIKYCLLLIFITAVKGLDVGLDQDLEIVENPILEIKTENVEALIEDIENTASTAEKARRQGIIPLEQIEDTYAQTLNKFEDISKSIQELSNAYKFLNANGVERIIITNIGINDERIIQVILTIIKSLFDVVPITSKALIPTNVIDKLLDIIENREKIELKGIALDIMHLWLPSNPIIQARIMKIKGLEPFYNQISKLDDANANKLLDLFNIILEEHMLVRNKMQNTNQDYIELKTYEKIGLIERMSTPIVCNGLLNIFELGISKGNLTLQIYKLVKKVEKFCTQVYKGKTKAIKFFEDIYDYLSEKAINGIDGVINITQEKEEIKKYIDNLKIVRTEL